MGDRVAVLKDGYLQQVDTPQNLYDRPVNLFVAAFIGSPSMNLCEAMLSGSNLQFGSRSLSLPDSVFAARPALRGFEGRKLILGFRPEDLEDASISTDADPAHRFTAAVTLVESLGSELMVHFDLDAAPVDAGDPDAVEEIGEHASGVGRFSPRSRVRSGTSTEIVVDVANLHFFDPESRQAIWS